MRANRTSCARQSTLDRISSSTQETAFFLFLVPPRLLVDVDVEKL